MCDSLTTGPNARAKAKVAAAAAESKNSSLVAVCWGRNFTQGKKLSFETQQLGLRDETAGMDRLEKWDPTRLEFFQGVTRFGFSE